MTYFYVSALLDDDSCETCSALDGREYPTIEAASEHFGPEGSNKGCTSPAGCRCSLVMVYEEA